MEKVQLILQFHMQLSSEDKNLKNKIIRKKKYFLSFKKQKTFKKQCSRNSRCIRCD